MNDVVEVNEIDQNLVDDAAKSNENLLHIKPTFYLNDSNIEDKLTFKGYSGSSSSKYDQAISKCSRKIIAAMMHWGAPGLAIAVSRKGETVWKAGFGFSDVENLIPCHPDAHMKIASVTKAIFTASIVAPLIEEKSVDLNDSIYKYITLEEFPKPKYKNTEVDINLKQLLSHTSGLAHYLKSEETLKPIGHKESVKVWQDDQQFNRSHLYNRKTYRTIFESMEYLNGGIVSEPGKSFYSTYAFSLLGACMERAIQKKEKFKLKDENAELTSIEETFIKVLHDKWGLRNTHLDYGEILIDRRVREYSRSMHRGALMNAQYTDTSYKWIGGGLRSTTSDLIKFGNKMIDSYKGKENAPLKRETVELLWTEVQSSYGLGFFVEKPKIEDEKLTIYHLGTTSGGSSILTIRPESDIVVAILINLDKTFMIEFSKLIASHFEQIEDDNE